jgi:hypothetical protein
MVLNSLDTMGEKIDHQVSQSFRVQVNRVEGLAFPLERIGDNALVTGFDDCGKIAKYKGEVFLHANSVTYFHILSFLGCSPQRAGSAQREQVGD